MKSNTINKNKNNKIKLSKLKKKTKQNIII